MKVFLTLLGLFLVGCCASPIEELLLRQEWTQYKTKYEKSYTEVEDQTRFGIFQNYKKIVAEHNEKYAKGEATYSMGVNHFSDWTTEERKNMVMSRPSGVHYTSGAAKIFNGTSRAAPDSMDWRSMGKVSPVKNQAQCGSCFAFAATGAIESYYLIQRNQAISVSEQQIVDCTNGNGNFGCGGGWPRKAYEYIARNGGIDSESSYPYEAQNNACRFNPGTISATLRGYVAIQSGNEEAMKQAVADAGPIDVIFTVTDAFYGYNGGVFYDPACSGPGVGLHAVLVVGYGNEGGMDYWLVKNSWGSWGIDGGYFKIARNMNHCGIANETSYPYL